MSATPLAPALEVQDRSFAAWLQRPPAQPRIRGHQQARHAEPGLRFAFYGRTSTGRFQDPASSQQWQREHAIRVISGRGRIVAEYFDVGYSRGLAWHHRPWAAALLDAAADPDRGFDAVVDTFTRRRVGAVGLLLHVGCPVGTSRSPHARGHHAGAATDRQARPT